MRLFAREFERCAAYIAIAGTYAGGMGNDGMHKFAYRHCELFADLLRLAAPALAAELDFARAEELPTAHAEPGRDRSAVAGNKLSFGTRNRTRCRRRNRRGIACGHQSRLVAGGQGSLRQGMAKSGTRFSHSLG